MAGDFDGVRRDAARRAINPRKRLVARRTSRWTPNLVINPEDNRPFTEAAAWDFLASALGKGQDIHEIEFEGPPRTRAYYMVISVDNDRRIYIKFQLGFEDIIGISFHNSEHD